MKLTGRREKKIDIRFTLEEFELLVSLERLLGKSRTDIIRERALERPMQTVLDARLLIGSLDGVGSELGKVGSNINQLAKYANTLAQQGALSPVVTERYILLLENHQKKMDVLEVLLRKLLRLISNG